MVISLVLFFCMVLLFFCSMILSIYVVLSFCLCCSLLFCCSVCSFVVLSVPSVLSMDPSMFMSIFFFSIVLLFYLRFYNVYIYCVQSMALSLCLWFCLVLFFCCPIWIYWSICFSICCFYLGFCTSSSPSTVHFLNIVPYMHCYMYVSVYWLFYIYGYICHSVWSCYLALCLY